VSARTNVFRHFLGIACAYPVNESDIETRYKQGFTVGILQSFNEMAFKTVAKGRQLAGR